ncbi:MAG UNVERIFIED_CONTAM: hypothetical protein LVR18_43160 [Planctomycetaceae bacterium]
MGGDDVAGWSVDTTDTGRSLQVQFRRTVADRSVVWFQLFSALPEQSQLDNFQVPISAVRGSGRDTGTVLLKTGPQFQMRRVTLSGVTQLNPDEAPQPDGESLPGRPAAAWRYAATAGPGVSSTDSDSRRADSERAAWTAAGVTADAVDQ